MPNAVGRVSDKLLEHLSLPLHGPSDCGRIPFDPLVAAWVQAARRAFRLERTMATPRVAAPGEKIAAFCRDWQITEFALFGSVLRDDFRPESDIDVLVTFAPDVPWSFFDWIDMMGELEAIFGRPVDLVARDGLRNPFRRHEILTTREVIYAA
jgi:predicted nucleotidyltransferase